MSVYPPPSRPWTRAQSSRNGGRIGVGRVYPHQQQQLSRRLATPNTSYSIATSKEARLASFVPRVVGQTEMEGCVQVWRMPMYLSQSRLGERTQPSNACTIIALKMAEQLHRQCVFFPSTDRRIVSPTSHPLGDYRATAGRRMPLITLQQQANTLAGSARYAAGEDERRLGMTESTALLQTAVHMARLPLVNALTNAIVDGNVIHEWAVRQRNNGEQNFTIPDAIAACEYVVQELDFSTVKGPIWRNLAIYVRRAVSHQLSQGRTHVFLMVIAFERSILLVYQPHDRTIGMADSHSHGHCDGAVLACASISQLDRFCLWIARNIFPESSYTDVAVQEFEISAIEFAGGAEAFDSASAVYRNVSMRRTIAPVPVPLTTEQRGRVFQVPTSVVKQPGKRLPSPTRAWPSVPVKHFKPETTQSHNPRY